PLRRHSESRHAGHGAGFSVPRARAGKAEGGMATTKPDIEHEDDGVIPVEIVPFAPALYLAWADGRLSAEEIAAVRRRAGEVDGLDADVRRALDEWLDPDRPPEPQQ